LQRLVTDYDVSVSKLPLDREKVSDAYARFGGEFETVEMPPFADAPDRTPSYTSELSQDFMDLFDYSCSTGSSHWFKVVCGVEPNDKVFETGDRIIRIPESFDESGRLKLREKALAEMNLQSCWERHVEDLKNTYVDVLSESSMFEETNRLVAQLESFVAETSKKWKEQELLYELQSLEDELLDRSEKTKAADRLSEQNKEAEGLRARLAQLEHRYKELQRNYRILEKKHKTLQEKYAILQSKRFQPESRSSRSDGGGGGGKKRSQNTFGNPKAPYRRR
jgi:hypothetical protein